MKIKILLSEKAKGHNGFWTPEIDSLTFEKVDNFMVCHNSPGLLYGVKIKIGNRKNSYKIFLHFMKKMKKIRNFYMDDCVFTLE